MKAVLSQVGGWKWETSRRRLVRSRHTVMRTKASHSWKGKRLQMAVQKYWSPSSYDHANINNGQRFHLKPIFL